MSRKIIAKAVVKGTLKTLTPLSVGGAASGEHVDIELAQDGTGKFYIPGTSIAGAIRSWLERHYDKKITDNIFGSTDGAASLLYINDCPVSNPIKERRHGISINDDTGTVFGREGFFYTRALLPRGTYLPLNISLDIVSKEQTDVLAIIIGALEQGLIRFGACRTRGMGKLELTGTEINYYDFLNDNTALDKWLNNEPAQINLERPELASNDTFCANITWQPASPLMVKSGSEGIKTKIMPLVSGVEEGEAAPVIPGSSLKGIFRAHARKIIKTIFCQELNEAEKLKLVDDMFGSTERAGRIMIDDVYCGTSVNTEGWLDEENNTLDVLTSENQHVAIDRFTGGASEGALYNARPVKSSCQWDPISVTINSFPAVSDEMLKQELALLKLLLRDFADGYISVGFGSRRGLGEIGNVKVEYSPSYPADDELQKYWDKFIKGE